MLSISSYPSWLHIWSFSTGSHMDITTSYIASRFASNSSSLLIVLMARIFHIYFCVAVVFSSGSGAMKVIIFSCFKHFHMSAPFLYVVDAYSCSFSSAFRYKSRPFLPIENSTPFSNSGTSQSTCFNELLFL